MLRYQIGTECPFGIIRRLGYQTDAGPSWKSPEARQKRTIFEAQFTCDEKERTGQVSFQGLPRTPATGIVETHLVDDSVRFQYNYFFDEAKLSYITCEWIHAVFPRNQKQLVNVDRH